MIAFLNRPEDRAGMRQMHRWLCTVLVLLPLMACHADEGPVLVRADGSQDALSAHRGKWVLVNYWAEWCAPCRQEIPELNALQAERAAELTVYGVNYDGLTGGPLDALATKMGIRFPLLRDDPGPALGIPRPEVLPTTVVIAPDGRITTLVGPQTRATLTSALGGPG